MSAFVVDLTSATPLSKDGAAVPAHDVLVTLAVSKRVSASNPNGDLQIAWSLEAHVDASGGATYPHAPEYVMRNSSPSDTLAFTVGGLPVDDTTNPAPVLSASIGPSYLGLGVGVIP